MWFGMNTILRNYQILSQIPYLVDFIELQKCSNLCGIANNLVEWFRAIFYSNLCWL